MEEIPDWIIEKISPPKGLDMAEAYTDFIPDTKERETFVKAEGLVRSIVLTPRDSMFLDKSIARSYFSLLTRAARKFVKFLDYDRGTEGRFGIEYPHLSALLQVLYGTDTAISKFLGRH